MAAITSTSSIPATTSNSLEYMTSIFEKEGELPVLDVGQRELTTVTAAEMPFFLMKGSAYVHFGKPFFALKDAGRVQIAYQDSTSSREWYLINTKPFFSAFSLINDSGEIDLATMKGLQTRVTELISLDPQYRICFTATVLTTVQDMPLDVQKIVFSYIGNVPNLPTVIQNADTAVTGYEAERRLELKTAVVVANN